MKTNFSSFFAGAYSGIAITSGAILMTAGSIFMGLNIFSLPITIPCMVIGVVLITSPLTLGLITLAFAGMRRLFTEILTGKKTEVDSKKVLRRKIDFLKEVQSSSDEEDSAEYTDLLKVERDILARRRKTLTDFKKSVDDTQKILRFPFKETGTIPVKEKTPKQKKKDKRSFFNKFNLFFKSDPVKNHEQIKEIILEYRQAARPDTYSSIFNFDMELFTSNLHKDFTKLNTNERKLLLGYYRRIALTLLELQAPSHDSHAYISCCRSIKPYIRNELKKIGAKSEEINHVFSCGNAAHIRDCFDKIKERIGAISNSVNNTPEKIKAVKL
jgi:hypothetical protein